MNWLSAMNSASMGAAGLYSTACGGNYGQAFTSSASALFGSQWGSGGMDSVLGTGLVGSSLGGMMGYGSQGYPAGCFGNSLAGMFSQQPVTPPYASLFSGSGYGSYGSTYGTNYASYGSAWGNNGMGSMPPPPPPPPGGSDDQGTGSYGNYGFGEFSGLQGPYHGVNPLQRPDSQSMTSTGGTLTQEGGDGHPITYSTSGGYTVGIDGSTVTVTDPTGKNTVQEWGDPHENVNGATTGDWSGTTRSLLLADGTKITMSAEAANSTIQSTSIYDGSQEIQVDNTSNTINSVTNNFRQARHDERQQADGDTAYFGVGKSGTEVFKNFYTQGSDYTITRNHRDIATLNQPWS